MKSKKNNLVKKFTKKDMSIIMTRAHRFKDEIPMNERTDSTFSDCLRKSWHIAKNGENTLTFEEVYNKYYSQMFNYIKSKVKDSDLAQDLTQDLFIKLHKHLDKYDVYKAKIITWLYRIALNVVIDHVRTSHANKFVHVNQFVDNETSKETFQFTDDVKSEANFNMENDELEEKIDTAFYDLKPEYRKIGTLYFIHQLSYNEIAELLNIPMGTVKGMLNRCREKLQENLQEVRVEY